MNDHDPSSMTAFIVSLDKAANDHAKKNRINMYAAYSDGGGVAYMAAVFTIACSFDDWSDEHIDFTKYDECWPYDMEERFGAACIEVLGGVECFDQWDNDCCRKVAEVLNLPTKTTGGAS